MLPALFGTLPKQLNNEKKPLLLPGQPSSCPDLALGRVCVLCSIPSQNVHCPIGFCIWTLEFITNDNIHLLTQPPIILPLVPNISYHTQKILKTCLVSASQLKQIYSKPIFKKQLREVHTTKNSKGIKLLIVHQLKWSKNIGFFSHKLFLQETKAPYPNSQLCLNILSLHTPLHSETNPISLKL